MFFFHFTFYWGQNDGLWSHLSSFISSSAITVSSWRLTAAPLMWKHALRQIYGTVESAAKLSKNIFFMHFHHAQKRQSRWEARFKGSEHTRWRSVTVDWLRCGFKRTSAQSRKSVFLLFHASSNRMIYSISTGRRANISSELMTQTAEQTNAVWLHLHLVLLLFRNLIISFFNFIYNFIISTFLTAEKHNGNNNCFYILLPARQKFPPQKAEMQISCLRSFSQITGIKNIFSCRNSANKSLYYANHVHLIFP